jgi:hypothetical protein
MSGLYNEKVVIKNKGNANKHLVLKSQSDTLAIIDGTGISMVEWGNGLIHVNNLAYIDIIGFKVINSKANGIYAGSSNHIRVSQCKTYLGYLLPATKYYLCVHGVSKRSNGI